MKKLLLSSIVASAITATLSAAGDMPKIELQGNSIGVEAGIYGFGLNYKAKFNDYIGVRASFDKFKKNDIEITEDTNGIETNYNFDLDLNDLLFIADYHPWSGNFKFSAGMIINNSNLDGVITPSQKDNNDIEFTFNGHTYSTKKVGSVNTKVDWDPVAPYVGIGWDTSFDKNEGWGFTCDLGVAFQGSAKATYSVNYGDQLKDNPDDNQIEREAKAQARQEIKNDLDKEMTTLQDDLDDYKILPYISLGVNYKF